MSRWRLVCAFFRACERGRSGELLARACELFALAGAGERRKSRSRGRCTWATPMGSALTYLNGQGRGRSSAVLLARAGRDLCRPSPEFGPRRVHGSLTFAPGSCGRRPQRAEALAQEVPVTPELADRCLGLLSCACCHRGAFTCRRWRYSSHECSSASTAVTKPAPVLGEVSRLLGVGALSAHLQAFDPTADVLVHFRRGPHRALLRGIWTRMGGSQPSLPGRCHRRGDCCHRAGQVAGGAAGDGRAR